ncbi:hypothetical protein CVT26_000514 [Gymnopilus dilepis]|uniref:Uncharacterized protein n=1 Tax=Gymnopilus dilepis TaxID=231916 RepID=A0A409WL11_9AGAR|nr:hypothetical protein CVT26_000514 [Gymnopilus dilepis]
MLYSDYSAYSIEDMPERWSIPLKKVRLEVEETVHYDVHSSTSSYEWSGSYPTDMGSVRFLPGFAAGQISMPHQLHCIESLQEQLRGSGPDFEKIDWAHTDHCLNYLRQWALCRADLTLEPGDFTHRDFDMDRQGISYECLDWHAVYDGLASDWDTWTTLWVRKRLDRFVLYNGSFK